MGPRRKQGQQEENVSPEIEYWGGEYWDTERREDDIPNSSESLESLGLKELPGQEKSNAPANFNATLKEIEQIGYRVDLAIDDAETRVEPLTNKVDVDQVLIDDERERNEQAKQLLKEIYDDCHNTLMTIIKQLRKRTKLKNADAEEIVQFVCDNQTTLPKKTVDLGMKYDIIQNILQTSENHGKERRPFVEILKDVQTECSKSEVMQDLDKKVDSRLMKTLKAIGKFFTKPLPKVHQYVVARFFTSPAQKLKQQLQQKMNQAEKQQLFRKDVLKKNQG